jgi:hypothetical protein
MARRMKLKQTKAATKKPTIAIAVRGFLNRGARGLRALRMTPPITPATKIGYLETVSQRFCIVVSNIKFSFMISE